MGIWLNISTAIIKKFVSTSFGRKSLNVSLLFLPIISYIAGYSHWH